jgi:hypothetical protein
VAIKELTCLGTWRHSGELAANTEWRPSASSGGGELETKEVAEVRYVEIRPPVAADGTIEALDHVYLMLDDISTREYVNLCGRQDALMMPPRQHLHANIWVPFGDGIVEAMKDQAPMLASTTLKYRQSVRPVVRAGATAVTADFMIRLWGYRYTEDELRKILDRTVMSPARVDIVDKARERVFSFEKEALLINWDNWQMLPGGPRQGKPAIMPYFRWARNAQATTPNTPYQLRFETGNVAEEEMNLYWPYDTLDKALLIKGLGVRAAANLKYAWIENTGDPIHKEHPKGKFEISEFNNPLHFGAAQPLYPAGYPLYFAIPRFADDSLLIWNDLAYVAIQDNQTPVAAGSVYVAVNGIAFDLRK